MSGSQQPVYLGTFTAGEIPPALTTTFYDSANNKIDLSTGGLYAGQWKYRRHRATDKYPFDSVDPAEVVRSAVVAANQTTNRGEVTYAWVAGDMTTAGDYEGNMWATAVSGVPKYASVRYSWTVVPALT